VFTIKQRDELREYVLRLAKSDHRVVAGALVGSLVEGGDRFSDLDLTFAVAEGLPVDAVLADWTATLNHERDGVHLVDLTAGPTTYRVLLFPAGLQLDLSMTPARQFRPGGPRFRKLFGDTARGEPAPRPPSAQSIFIPAPPVPEVLLGWAVVYALHARACIERGRVWQAEHYVGAVRDHALTLACLRLQLPAVQARGFDELPSDLLRDRFGNTHVLAVEPAALRTALSASVTALFGEAEDGRVEAAQAIEARMPAFD
jgi:hypothetical protein